MGQWTQVRPLREEMASTLIQGAAAAASIAALAYLVQRGWRSEDGTGIAALAVYGGSMCLAFLASALYHGVQRPRVKRMLRGLDHCTIFLLIAGTYTPVALLPLRHHGGVALLAAIWTLAIGGIVLRLTQESLYHRLAVPLYVLMGWLALGWGVPLLQEIGRLPILLMVAGGLTYTGGLLFYRWHRLPFGNSLWHVCVVGGAAWFFAATTFFLPG